MTLTGRCPVSRKGLSGMLASGATQAFGAFSHNLARRISDS